jgi:hypothetical protein
VKELRESSAQRRDIAFRLTLSEYGELHPELRLLAIDVSR